jgi:DNA recombination protein RmuC
MSPEFVLLVIASAGAGVSASFAILCFLRTQQLPAALTAQGAQILRAETDIVRAVIEEQARGLRQELGHSLKGLQELTLAAFGTLRDGIDAQVRGFGERLDGGIRGIDERAAAISIKLNAEMAQMRSEANANRETLRTLIEQKLNYNIGQQAEASKILRDELGGNFHRLGTRVSDSLTEAGQIQKERLEIVTAALTGLTEKLGKAQDNLRTAVESRLDAIRQESATKLEEMRQTVDEKLQTTLESRLGESFNRVVEQLERVHKGIGEMQTLAANVGDLRNVLTNVKVRGTYGEVQLALLLEQFLSPDQFVKMLVSGRVVPSALNSRLSTKPCAGQQRDFGHGADTDWRFV